MFNYHKEKWTGSTESIEYRTPTGPFLGLLLLSAFSIAAVVFFVWFIPTIGLRNIHPSLPYITGALFLAIGAFILLGAAFITIALVKGRVLFYSSWMRWLLVKVFLPLMTTAGNMMGIEKIKIEQAFIEINNQIVRFMKKTGRLKPERLLILMPHCIQWDNCKIKVTRNVQNCAGCGKCEIGNLLALSNEFNISLFISTGGSVARRKVYEDRPDAVVAVACERDLTSGLQDSYPLPVIGLINKRPKGYCIETGIDLKEIRQAIVDLAG